MKQAFEVSDKHYTWLALRARARVHDWQQVRKLINKGGFFSRANSPIGFEPFLATVQEFGGPLELMVDIATIIPEKEERYLLSVKYGIYEVAIKTLVASKNINKLVDLSNLIVERLGDVAETSVSFRNQINEALAEIKKK